MLRDPVAVLAACQRVAEAIAKSKAVKQRERLERQLEKAVAKVFRAQGKAFLASLDDLVGWQGVREASKEADDELVTVEMGPSYDPSKYVAKAFETASDATRDDFEAAIDSTTRKAVSRAAKATIANAGGGIAFDLKNKRAVDFLKDRAAEKVAGVDDTTRETLRSIIAKGAEEGWSYDRIAKAITDKYESFAEGRPQEHIDSRAHLIAVTEIGEAFCEGQMIAGRELADAGIEMEKSWLTVGDDKVSEECQENADAGWIPLEDQFPSGDDRPLAHPACRCDLLMRAKGAEE